jgi:adenylate kinase
VTISVKSLELHHLRHKNRQKSILSFLSNRITVFSYDERDMHAYNCHGIVLLGPTGSGKTPLGEALAECGINDHPAAHFDFGSNLRTAVTVPGNYPLLSPEDIALLERKLRDNALLEDHEFYIAERILGSFITTRNLGPGDYLILNGLPRHTGQAQALESLLALTLVIYLECTSEVVQDRIRSNAGGDRTHRSDDSTGEIERKLAIFAERTAPLLGYYRSCNIPVRTVHIEPGMSTAATAALTGLVN